MNSILEPLLAILAIVVPLGLAYAILLWQSRKPPCDGRKVFAGTRDDPQQKRTKLPRAKEERAVR